MRAESIVNEEDFQHSEETEDLFNFDKRGSGRLACRAPFADASADAFTFANLDSSPRFGFGRSRSVCVLGTKGGEA
ncbi:MAG: hypothetical protein AB8B50_15750 [Pirellulaceae bacterium]